MKDEVKGGNKRATEIEGRLTSNAKYTVSTARIAQAAQSLAGLHGQYNQAMLDLQSISYLKAIEDRAGVERVRKVEQEAAHLLAVEAALQREYAELI